jgi:cob(I)alamin adenosyltransferase
MPIYTKKGDFGETGIYKPGKSRATRMSKGSRRIDAIGAVDELNSFLGLVLSQASFDDKESIVKIQRNLFKIGSKLAGSRLKFTKNEVEFLEIEIDRMEDELPKLKNFILPGGGKVGGMFHFARTIARRAERSLVKFAKSEKVDGNALSYLNRLSDYLFVRARYENLKEGVKEKIWKTGFR